MLLKEKSSPAPDCRATWIYILLERSYDWNRYSGAKQQNGYNDDSIMMIAALKQLYIIESNGLPIIITFVIKKRDGLAKTEVG